MKGNKVSKNPIRVSQEVANWLKSEVHREWQRTGSEPTFADIIDRLWLAASGQLPTQKDSGSTGTSKPVGETQIVSESDQGVLKHTSCTPDEFAHVARLLTVLRSSKPHLPDAIKMNLEQFSDLHEAWSREQQSAKDAKPQAGAGKPVGVAGAEPEDPNLTKAKEGILRVAKDPGLSLPDVSGGRKPRRGPKSGTG